MVEKPLSNISYKHVCMLCFIVFLSTLWDKKPGEDTCSVVTKGEWLQIIIPYKCTCILTPLLGHGQHTSAYLGRPSITKNGGRDSGPTYTRARISETQACLPISGISDNMLTQKPRVGKRMKTLRRHLCHDRNSKTEFLHSGLHLLITVVCFG